ncbi:hypothetical protein HYDPIDRAFT_117368 [Hydnomerulius pinastri MD-312]|uniref:U6 snRNA phosphodiesterase 1 n=1 Tax=Hydnomerulius pinastri MD-312 TaxID=994086 RepID=A0A0C9W2R0_9AGAM|nr:hypothetical protein HYDPIDRAFT_117368 [Hydnomerulius pinastri MD-312]
MKRGSVGLVAYSSSEEDEKPASELARPKKKRKLPTLSPSLSIPVPVDNPALHQGRVRAVPHVEGQYATYIYVPLVLHPKEALYTLVEDVLGICKGSVPAQALHSIGRQENQNTGSGIGACWELHISLSRPLFLRAHQREDFKRAIKKVALSQAPFDASFATFSELTNDEKTRTFLALEVGAGHQEFRRCLDFLTPTLRSLRQKEFYTDPKFHASIAWALLEQKVTPSDLSQLQPPVSTAGALDEDALPSATSPANDETPPPSSTERFPRIPHFPPDLVPSLNQTYEDKLSQAKTGGFVVDRISVKIGRDVFTWPLKGTQ